MGVKSIGVKLVAEQVTETHRTLENDRTVSEVELPGLVNVYLEFDGGRVLFDQIKAGRVLDAIELAKQNQPTETTDTGGTTGASGTATTNEPAPQSG